jgi:1-acyl-sn-glycerol-3-phosphate acyltransferase
LKKKDFQPRTVYYTDELNDEFSSAVITPKRIDEKYKYRRDKGLSRIACFFWYRVVALPIATVYLKLKFHHKILGRKKLALHKKDGIFVYGNHTQPTADALIPTFVSFPRPAFVIVHPNNVSMPFLGRVTPYMGALPLPDGLGAARNFTAAVKSCTDDALPVFIYPEAHIWPYYTGIRPFGDMSFSYPVRYGKPVYAFTNVYLKRRSPKKARIVTYIDGPFYPDASLNAADARRKLRDEVYGAMCERARLSDCVIVEYKRLDRKNSEDI